MTRGVRELIPNQDTSALASEYGIVLPKIQITDKVDLRLHRHGRVLEYSEIDLLNGAMSYGIENDVRVIVDALPKNDEQHVPSLEYDQYENTTHLRVDTKPEADFDPNRLLNIALWAGVVVLDELAEGREYEYTKHMKKTRFRQHFVKPQVGNLVAGAPNIGSAVGLYTVGTPLSVGFFSLAIVASGNVIRNLYLDHRKRKDESVTDFIAKYKKDDIESLAKNHPVLSYDAALDLGA